MSRLPHKDERGNLFLKVAGVFFALTILLLLLAALIVQPYARLERLASEILTRHAPAGTVVGGVDVGFPLTLAITNLTVPIQVHDQQRELLVKEVSGKVSVLSFLQGKVQAGMNADFFGGVLWLDIDLDQPRHGSSSQVGFDARARSLNMSELCTFFDSPVNVLGLCDADIAGEVDEYNPRTLAGKAIFMGREMEIPPVVVEKLILPENRRASFKAQLSAGEQRVLIDSFKLEGTGYELVGSGTVMLADPPDLSSLDGTFSAVFKEQPIITDEELAGKGTDYVLDTLVSTRSKVFFKLKGTLQKPQVELDSRSSIGALVEQFGR